MTKKVTVRSWTLFTIYYNHRDKLLFVLCKQEKKYIKTLSSYLCSLNFRMVGIQFPIFQLQKSKRTSKLYLSVVSDIRLFFCLGSCICVYLCKIALRSGICWNLMALLSSFSIALWVISLTVVWWRFNTSLS